MNLAETGQNRSSGEGRIQPVLPSIGGGLRVSLWALCSRLISSDRHYRVREYGHRARLRLKSTQSPRVLKEHVQLKKNSVVLSTSNWLLAQKSELSISKRGLLQAHRLRYLYRHSLKKSSLILGITPKVMHQKFGNYIM